MRGVSLLPCPIWALALLACSPEPAAEAQAAEAQYNFGSNLSEPEHFFDAPYPSDLRKLSNGAPDVRGLAGGTMRPIIEGVRVAALDRKGFPVLPVGYFRFSASPAPRDVAEVLPAQPTSPLLLVDVDPSSPDRGALYPTVAHVLPPDAYAPSNVLAVAARPGIVLAPKRQYAFVVLRSANDAQGRPLGVPRALREPTPEVAAWLAPTWETLGTLGIARRDVAAATAFTTGDVVADLAAQSDAMLRVFRLEVKGLRVAPDRGASHERFCELAGEISFPQFQRGKPPFDAEGLFDPMGPLPMKQRDEVAPVRITFPKTVMPKGGFPLNVYIHGTGGLSSQVVDRGPKKSKGGENTPGEGPAFVLAAHGIATASAAMPLNPERLGQARALEYLNFGNPVALRDTFRQGAIEQRLFLDALERVRIAPEDVASCGGLRLPPGEVAFHFGSPALMMGQSMGGMYTNIVAAIDPRIRAIAPTGAGGYLSYFPLKTRVVEGAALAIGSVILGTDVPLTPLHPAMHLLQTAWEPVDPIVYVPRLGVRPLPGHPARSIYEPVGMDDAYFAREIYDAMILAYGHKQAGDVVWPTTQEALAQLGRDGIEPYPVRANAPGVGTDRRTSVAVQYAGDGIDDPHDIFVQLDAVKYQYGCFFRTFVERGIPTVPAPAPLGTPCP